MFMFFVAALFAVLWLYTEFQLANALAAVEAAANLLKLAEDVAAWEQEMDLMALELETSGPFGL